MAPPKLLIDPEQQSKKKEVHRISNWYFLNLSCLLMAAGKFHNENVFDNFLFTFTRCFSKNSLIRNNMNRQLSFITSSVSKNIIQNISN